MAVQTPTINLTKPAGGEPVQVLILNENWDKVDEAVKSLQDRSTKLEAGNGTQLSRSANFNTTTGEAAIVWTDTDYSDGDWQHANGVFTCVRAGIYYVSCQYTLLAGTAIVSTLTFRKGSTNIGQSRSTRNPAGDTSHSGFALAAFAVGDTLSAGISSTAAVTIDCTAKRTLIALHRVRDL